MADSGPLELRENTRYAGPPARRRVRAATSGITPFA